MDFLEELSFNSDEYRYCKRCNDIKPISEFAKAKRKEGKGYRYRCKKCQKDSYDKMDYKNGKSSYHRKRKYGINQDQFLQLIENQNGNCGICKTKLDIGIARNTHVDHCHKTGVIRGILCQTCNTKLGWYENNSSKIEEYLTKANFDYKNYIPSDVLLY